MVRVVFEDQGQWPRDAYPRRPLATFLWVGNYKHARAIQIVACLSEWNMHRHGVRASFHPAAVRSKVELI